MKKSAQLLLVAATAFAHAACTQSVKVGFLPLESIDERASSSSGTGGEGGAREVDRGSGGEGGSTLTPCSTCAQFITSDLPPSLCSDAVSVYESYASCMCDGACAIACGDTCKKETPSTACELCMIGSDGCGAQFQGCIASQ